MLDFSHTMLEGIAAIDGRAGDDVIFGSAEADRIIGGAGMDIMTGGRGADVFVFQKVSDSVAGSTADHITDFKSGADKIDLSAVDANAKLAGQQSFTFIGHAEFTGLGQLRIGTDASGHLALFGNTTGDLKPDFEIVLDHTHALHMADLVI